MPYMVTFTINIPQMLAYIHGSVMGHVTTKTVNRLRRDTKACGFGGFATEFAPHATSGFHTWAYPRWLIDVSWEIVHQNGWFGGNRGTPYFRKLSINWVSPLSSDSPSLENMFPGKDSQGWWFKISSNTFHDHPNWVVAMFKGIGTGKQEKKLANWDEHI